MNTTTLRNINLVEVADFAMTEEEVQKLRFVQMMQLPVEVIGEACDGYFDVKLTDGTVVHALSEYHLNCDCQPQEPHELKCPLASQK